MEPNNLIVPLREETNYLRGSDNMEKIKGTLEEQLKLEKEYKESTEKMLRLSFEKAQKENRAGETNIGSKLVSYSLDTCVDNVKQLFTVKKEGLSLPIKVL